MYEIDLSILTDNIDKIMYGIWVTAYICALSAFFAFLTGSFLFFLRWNRFKPTQKAAYWFVEFIKNTPLLIQLYILYKGFPQIGISFSAELCGIIALSIYSGVYMSENLRAGANSLQNSQKLAAFSLGFTDIQTFIYIIYPQTLKNSILTLGSQFINLVKNSTLVSFIAVTDIFYVISQGISDNFRVIEYMLLGICVYGTVSLCVSALANYIEAYCKKKFGRSEI